MHKSGGQKFIEAFGFFMMLVLLALGIGLVWLGGREYSLFSRFPKPEAISFDDLVRKKPADGWYQITGAVLDLRNIAWEEETGSNTITRAFVPLRSTRNSAERSIHVLVDTKTSDIIGIVQQMQASGKTDRRSSPFPSGLPGGMFGQRNLLIPRPVEGLISYSGQGGVIASRLASANIELQKALEPGYIYLNEGGRPSMGAAAGFILMGLILIAMTIVCLVKAIHDSRAIRVG